MAVNIIITLSPRQEFPCTDLISTTACKSAAFLKKLVNILVSLLPSLCLVIFAFVLVLESKTSEEYVEVPEHHLLELILIFCVCVCVRACMHVGGGDSLPHSLKLPPKNNKECIMVIVCAFGYFLIKAFENDFFSSLLLPLLSELIAFLSVSRMETTPDTVYN